MLPVLFAHDATSWDSFGIGILSDAIICDVEENRNGSYELELQYPITGAFFNDIALRSLILAKPNYTDGPQPFRVYKISKPLNGVVTIEARHISYDLSGYVDGPFVAIGAQGAMTMMLSSSVVTPAGCPFTFRTDITSTQLMKPAHPQSVRALMGGVEGSLIDTFGGEWHFDGYDCTLNAARGANRGVTIQYGKNLTDLRQEENNDTVYTAVYPYYYNADLEAVVTLPEKTIQVPGTFPYARVMPLDLTYEFESTPTQTQLRTHAQAYIDQHNIGVPKINLNISFVEADSMTDRVDLCDTVTVRFDKLGVSATAKCIRTKWDVLKGRYIEAELGSARNSFADTIATTHEIARVIDERTSQFQAVAAGIASKVTGNTGGYIVLHDTNNDGEPDEILIMDSDDITTAVNIIRMNNSGIAFSQAGYAGPYTTAWNIDGQFVADFIAAGSLHTDNVTIFGDSQFKWDAANLTMVDPSNTNNVIRFGKYDGTHYGLGFSTDGGQTWLSGFSFDGIKFMRGTDSASIAAIGDGYFYISNNTGVTITRVGNGNCIDETGSVINAPYYHLGTTKGNDRDGNQYSFVQAHGAYCFTAGRYNLPHGAYSICAGYDCEAIAQNAIALGDRSTAKGLDGIALGYRCYANGTDSIAIGCLSTSEKGNSISIGLFCQANNTDGLSIGDSCKSNYGCAIGYHVHENGEHLGSTGIGKSLTLNNDDAAAIGSWLRTSRDGQFVCGRYNADNSAAIFILGYGTGNADADRRNAATIDNSGNMTIAGRLTQNSDERLKTKTGNVPDVSKIKAVRYKWNENKRNRDDLEHIGYIAQDVEKVAPYLVQEDEKGYKTLDYIGLLCAKIEMLENTVNVLMSRLEEIEKKGA